MLQRHKKQIMLAAQQNEQPSWQLQDRLGPNNIKTSASLIGGYPISSTGCQATVIVHAGRRTMCNHYAPCTVSNLAAFDLCLLLFLLVKFELQSVKLHETLEVMWSYVLWQQPCFNFGSSSCRCCNCQRTVWEFFVCSRFCAGHEAYFASAQVIKHYRAVFK